MRLVFQNDCYGAKFGKALLKKAKPPKSEKKESLKRIYKLYTNLNYGCQDKIKIFEKKFFDMIQLYCYESKKGNL